MDHADPVSASPAADALKQRLIRRDANIAIIGLGYVGLPLAAAVYKAGFVVTGFDIDPQKVATLNGGSTYLQTVPAGTIAAMRATGRFTATDEPAQLGAADVVVICVPTPLTKQRAPDLSFVVATAETVAKQLRPGQLIVLESTTYPGTTSGIVKPVLERVGLRSEVDFWLAYAPEREDPGNARYRTADIPRVVSGDGPLAVDLAASFYGQVVCRVVPVSSTDAAEAVKITENVFRAVNIALVNELKLIYGRMGIDIWEIIDAAATKPFGFMPFYPGPGLGGHCLPIDPFYLAWKARELDVPTRFIELAGEINRAMPSHVVDALTQALSRRKRKSLNGAKILLIGMAYKKNVDDLRESPALVLIDLIEERGGRVDYFDPLVPRIPPTREHPELTGRRSVPWDPAGFGRYDAVLICTDHDGIDYRGLLAATDLVIDTRNAMAGFPGAGNKVIKA